MRFWDAYERVFCGACDCRFCGLNKSSGCGKNVVFPCGCVTRVVDGEVHFVKFCGQSKHLGWVPCASLSNTHKGMKKP